MRRLISPSLAHQRISAVISCALLLLAVSSAFAQSGRVAPKHPDTTPNAGTIVPPDAPPKTPPPKSSSASQTGGTEAAATAPQYTLVVLKFLPYMNSSRVLTDTAAGALTKRLADHPSLKVTGGADASRKEAIDQAKNSKDAYIVWVQLENDGGMSDPSNGMGYPDYRNLYINYIVYAPGTGKVKTQGRVYQGANAGPGSVTLPTSNSEQAIQYYLQQAGAEAGDRILSALSITSSRPPIHME